MILIIKGHNYEFEMQNICRLFLPFEKIKVTDDVNAAESADSATVVASTLMSADKTGVILSAALSHGDRHLSAKENISADTDGKEIERRLAVMLYSLFAKHFNFRLPWGAVTGVRPVKLMRRISDKYGSEQAAADWLKKYLLVSEDKVKLCLETLITENKIIKLSQPQSFSLYISVPFCPSRCDYCSFVSHTVERAARLIPEYVEKLCREIEYTGSIARRLGLQLETIYVGGGTPTVLSAAQLARILNAVHDSFDLSCLREFTVEAGRPDTVEQDKLEAIKSAGTTRISINPQTLNDDVLKSIGRRHSADRFFEAYKLARLCGFDNINTDLIAGLPGDDYDGFKLSLEKLIGLAPESITVHTLAMKRASNFMKNYSGLDDCSSQSVRMVDLSICKLKSAGYRPYYLYRQSRTVGGTENTGWSKPSYEGLYNVFMMDETHTVLACGAGAVTKLKQPDGDCIERIFNYKFPYEYNERFDDMIQRKGRVISFYETFF